MNEIEERDIECTNDKQDRRGFFKQISKYLLGFTAFAIASLWGLKYDGKISLAKMKDMKLGLSEAHGSGKCGSAYECSGGGGKCGSAYECSGGGGKCGSAYECSGGGSEDSGGGGKCGSSYECSGGGGKCGSAYECSGR